MTYIVNVSVGRVESTVGTYDFIRGFEEIAHARGRACGGEGGSVCRVLSVYPMLVRESAQLK